VGRSLAMLPERPGRSAQANYTTSPPRPDPTVLASERVEGGSGWAAGFISNHYLRAPPLPCLSDTIFTSHCMPSASPSPVFAEQDAICHARSLMDVKFRPTDISEAGRADKRSCLLANTRRGMPFNLSSSVSRRESSVFTSSKRVLEDAG